MRTGYRAAPTGDGASGLRTPVRMHLPGSAPDPVRRDKPYIRILSPGELPEAFPDVSREAGGHRSSEYLQSRYGSLCTDRCGSGPEVPPGGCPARCPPLPAGRGTPSAPSSTHCSPAHKTSRQSKAGTAEPKRWPPPIELYMCIFSRSYIIRQAIVKPTRKNPSLVP